METTYINLRIKKGFGTKKVAKQVKDDEMLPIEGEYEWGNATPEHRGIYGEPPKPNVSEEGYKKNISMSRPGLWKKRPLRNSYIRQHIRNITLPFTKFHMDYGTQLKECPPFHINGTVARMEIEIHSMASFSILYCAQAMAKMAVSGTVQAMGHIRLLTLKSPGAKTIF